MNNKCNNSNNIGQTFLWRVRFQGRKIGADGIFYEIEEVVSGRDKEEAIINLYLKYEHITKIRFDEPTISQ